MRLIISTNQEDVLERGDVFIVDDATFVRIAEYAKFQALRMNQPPNTGLQADACPHCGDVGPKLWTGEHHICPMCRKRR